MAVASPLELQNNMAKEECPTRLGEPKHFFDQVALPIEFTIPQDPHPESDTVLVIDASLSMNEGPGIRAEGRRRELVRKPGAISRMEMLQSPEGLEKGLRALSKKPNQFLIVVKYHGNSGYNVPVTVKGVKLDRVPITRETLPEIIKAIKGIETHQGTPGIPGLRTALHTLIKTWKEKAIVDKAPAAELAAGPEQVARENKEVDNKGEAEFCLPRTNARLIVTTDGVWDEVYYRRFDSVDETKFHKFKQDLRALFKNIPPIPMDILGIDLYRESYKFLNIISSMGEEGSRIVIARTREMSKHLHKLMVTTEPRFLNNIFITYSVKGNPIISQSIFPVFTNQTIERHVFLPKEVINAATEVDSDEIDIKLEITFDDKTKLIRHHTVSTHLLKTTLANKTPLSEADNKKLIEQWIDDQIIAHGVQRRSHFNLLSGTEQFDIYSKIFLKSTEYSEMFDIQELIQNRMENCAEDWVNDRLCTLMKVDSIHAFEEKTLSEKLALLQTISENLQNMGLTQAYKNIKIRMAPLAYLQQICQAAEVKNESEFTAKDDEKQLLILKEVLKKNEETNIENTNIYVIEILKRKINYLNTKWIETELGKAIMGDNSHPSLWNMGNFEYAIPMKKYQAIITVADKANQAGKDEDVLEELNRLMLGVWVEAHLCEAGHVERREQFLRLPVVEQIQILEQLKESAGELEHEAGIKEINDMIEQIKKSQVDHWVQRQMDAALATIYLPEAFAAEKKPTFENLKAEERLQFFKNIEGIALQLPLRPQDYVAAVKERALLVEKNIRDAMLHQEKVKKEVEQIKREAKEFIAEAHQQGLAFSKAGTGFLERAKAAKAKGSTMTLTEKDMKELNDFDVANLLTEDINLEEGAIAEVVKRREQLKA